MSDPMRDGILKLADLLSAGHVYNGIEVLQVAHDEILHLRAMLPQKIDGLPTEPGWYWVRRRNGEWVLMEVYAGRSGQLLGTVDGREHAEPIREFRSLAPFYGPLTPPETSEA